MQLAWRQPFGAALGHLGGIEGGAKRLQPLDHGFSKRAQRGGVTLRHQRKETVKVLQPQPRQNHRRELPRQCGKARPQIRLALAFCQSEGRLDRAMEPVFARLRGDFRGGQAQVGLLHRTAQRGIPAQPGGRDIGKIPGRRGVIHGKTFDLIHARCLSGPMSHRCDAPMPLQPFARRIARQEPFA